jgi:ATP-binding cassette, subfamily B, bacterial
MGFIMDGLDAEAYDRTYRDRDLVRRVLSYFKPQAGRMLLVAVAISLTTLANALLPIYISLVIDRLQQAPDGVDFMQVTLIIIAYGLAAWGFNAIRGWFSAQAVGSVVLKLREDAFDAVLKRDLSFYDQFGSGKIVSRITNDTQEFSAVVTLTIDLLSHVLQTLVITIYLFTINAELTLILLAVAPIIFGVSLAFRRIARNTITQQRRVTAEVSGHIQETISGIGIAKAFRQERAIYDEFLKVNQRSFWLGLRRGYVFNAIFPVLSIIAGVATAALVYYGGLRATSGGITAGEWFLFIQGIGMFWFPMTSIASFWSQFQLGLAAAERVFAILDAEPKVVQTDAVKLPDVKGEIAFEHVKFRYVEAEGVLEDFSLTVPAGQAYALVGHTGSGKSSIAKLIARFYEYQGGSIKIDGRDIRTLDLADYRARLGIVTQTPFLFDGTVLENIRYGRPDATDEQVIAAAKAVGRGDWIASLPNGLQTEAGERGSGLSMGQRQLVALARVLLQDPSIFILDEATASVDPLTETLIQEGLDLVMKGRTSVVIAHRLSTIKQSDMIIVLRQGAIIERGTHDELLAQGGHYAELYNTYFRHQSLEYIEQSRGLAAD